MKDLLIQKYNSVLEDLLIGYPIDGTKLSEMLLIIHQLHFTSFSADSEAVFKILERYA